MLTSVISNPAISSIKKGRRKSIAVYTSNYPLRGTFSYRNPSAQAVAYIFLHYSNIP